MSGYTNKALAKETLILHPPDKDLVGLFLISSSKPKPFNILIALDSALSASISVNLS